MPQETNPFRRASMLQGTGFAGYLSNRTNQNGDINPPASPAPRRLTSVVWGTEKESTRAPSPVPEYTRRARDSHIVVPKDLVASMSSLEDDPEQVVRIATEISPPPKYLASNYHAKDSHLPDYDEAVNESAERIRRSAGLQGIGYNSAYPRYEDIRHIGESGEAARRKFEETNKLRTKLRRASGIWGWFKCCVPTRKAKISAGTMKPSKRLFCIVGLIFVLIIIVPVVVIKVITHNSPVEDNGAGEQKRLPAQMFELPGFPPIPTGVSLVQPAAVANKQSTCVTPPELWSCDLPPPATDATPEFRFEIRYRPADRQRDGPESIWIPRPAPVPSIKDYEETSLKESNTTSAGVATGFVISMTFNNKLPKSDEQSGTAEKRSEPEYSEEEASERAYLENHIKIIKRQSLADPSQNPPAMLPALLRNQPLRLMEKDLSGEHYAAHIYFQKSLYLDSINVSSQQPIHNNEVPGNSDKAKYACVWSFTRFKVQIYTKKNQDLVLVDRERNRFLIDPDFGSSISNPKDPILPYPVTISQDRITGNENAIGKNIACYEILPDSSGQGKRLGARRSWIEKKTPVVEISTLDGRRKEGCFCEWGNWKFRTKYDVGN
ncbi:hypothetical protein BGX38DRAFT_1141847 [Terfezia claveryi]|nr:hypothetical protein BGX38DRAFT_1141847 [Terfezia claveryi]